MSAVAAFVHLQSDQHRTLPAPFTDWPSEQYTNAGGGMSSESLHQHLSKVVTDLSGWLCSHGGTSCKVATLKEEEADTQSRPQSDGQFAVIVDDAMLASVCQLKAERASAPKRRNLAEQLLSCDFNPTPVLTCEIGTSDAPDFDKAVAHKAKPASEDVSTAVGSDTSSVHEESCQGEVHHDVTRVHGADATDVWSEEIANSRCVKNEVQELSDHSPYDDEQEEGADEECEFSLDGRLATMKRWRAYRARMEAPVAMLESSPTGVLWHGPPGLAPCQNDVSGASTNPAASGSQEQCRVNPHSLSVMKVEAGRLLENTIPWLQQQISTLSLEALKVDTWEALANTLPEDPEWQLVALIGCERLVGFCTYAFFDDGHGSVMSVHHFVISAVCRGMGCGRKLVAEISHRAEAHGAYAIRLHSKPEALEFYVKMEFVEIGCDHLMELPLYPCRGNSS
jgi:GNAT superfamily N-acetyltransferase